MSYSQIPVEVQLDVISTYLPLADVQTLRQSNSEYAQHLQDEDIRRTIKGSVEALELAISNDDPTLLERFFEKASLDLQDIIYRQRYPTTEDTILDFKDAFYSDLLLDVVVQNKSRIATWLSKEGVTFRDLDIETYATRLKIHDMVVKNPSIADCLDELALDNIVETLLSEDKRQEAIALTSKLIGKMDPEYLTNNLCQLFFPEDFLTVAAVKLEGVLDAISNSETMPLLMALLNSK